MFQGTLTITGGHFPPPILKIQPGDVIIIQSPHRLSRWDMDYIGSNTKKLFPDHKVIVFADGIHIQVAREAPTLELPDIDLKCCPICGQTAIFDYFKPSENSPSSLISVAARCYQHCAITDRFLCNDLADSFKAAAKDWNDGKWREKHIGKPETPAGSIPPPNPSTV